MITGFNTNVRHGGRVYHVQTEDSGRDHPHVISHLYHGGTILASEKREYGDLLGSEDLTGVVRRLMEEQHKAILERLRRGEFDTVIDARLDGGPGDTGDVLLSETPVEPPTDPPPAAPREAAEGPPPGQRAFGAGRVSEKPLDEVILEYLVQKARTRGGEARPQSGRGPRSRG